jgi:phosphate transport system substrate-binding protein
MKRFLISLIMITIFLMTSLSVFAEEMLILGAGQAPTENILKPIKEPFEKVTKIWLYFIPYGPKVALMELEKGKVDAALGGLSFEDWMNLMEVEKAGAKDPSILHHVIVGKDKIKVLIHKENPISKLTKEQLRSIFTGKIANWKDVGGKDMPIVIVWTKFLGGNYLFTKTILDNEPLTKDVIEVATSVDAREMIALKPGAIGLGPLAIVTSAIKSPETPEIERPITLITKGKPSPNVQKLIDFIKGEGQKYIKQ